MLQNPLSTPTQPPPPQFGDRLTQIAQAREAMLLNRQPPPTGISPLLARSWQRCLAQGHAPNQQLGFESVQPQAMSRTLAQNMPLLRAARPIIQTLAKAVADTRYFALLTDAQGVVIELGGPIDRHDRRATAIARLGVDLSERAVGTTAIGATLNELQPVWLHRGEHFFDDTAIYSCAGAPVIGPDGRCAGMLDLTGILVPERPALRHLVAQSARRIENALVQAQPHHLLLRLGWPGQTLGGDGDGLLAVARDGLITGFNPPAADMLGLSQATPLALDAVFAIEQGHLFDLARHPGQALEVPLWSGLRLQVMTQATNMPSLSASQPPLAPPSPGMAAGGPLRDVEDALIRRTVQDLRGNVAAAAKALGISRATVYRKLGKKG